MKKQTMNGKNQASKIAITTIVIVAMLFALAGCQANDQTGGKDNAADKTTAETTAAETTTAEKEKANIGEFKGVDLQGNEVTEDFFKQNDLTMVNVFSSTCNPCMAELPHLVELSNELKDKKFAILGINLDIDAEGNPDQNSKEMIASIIEKAGGGMTAIFPDDNLLVNVITKIDAIPYSFFVDKDGNIVGETYVGSHTKEEWAQIIEEALQ